MELWVVGAAVRLVLRIACKWKNYFWTPYHADSADTSAFLLQGHHCFAFQFAFVFVILLFELGAAAPLLAIPCCKPAGEIVARVHDAGRFWFTIRLASACVGNAPRKFAVDVRVALFAFWERCKENWGRVVRKFHMAGLAACLFSHCLR